MTTSLRSGIIREVAQLAETLQQRPDADLGDVLHELTRGAAEAMLGAQHAGITIAARNGKVRTASATDRFPVLLDEIQQRHAQGPCLSAAWEHHIMRIDMERFKIDAVQAVELLKRLSQSSNTPLTAVARQLVESEHRS